MTADAARPSEARHVLRGSRREPSDVQLLAKMFAHLALDLAETSRTSADTRTDRGRQPTTG